MNIDRWVDVSVNRGRFWNVDRRRPAHALHHRPTLLKCIKWEYTHLGFFRSPLLKKLEIMIYSYLCNYSISNKLSFLLIFLFNFGVFHAYWEAQTNPCKMTMIIVTYFRAAGGSKLKHVSVPVLVSLPLDHNHPVKKNILTKRS